MEKSIILGAKVVACSDSNGYIYDANGLSLQTIKRLKLHENARISEYIETHPDAEYFDDNSKIWSVPCDIALPCATQNEIDENRSEEHTSELQSRGHLVCRLLLEKQKQAPATS